MMKILKSYEIFESFDLKKNKKKQQFVEIF